MAQGHKETFQGMESVLYIDYVYTTVYICQNSWHCSLKLGEFYTSGKANCQPNNQ